MSETQKITIELSPEMIDYLDQFMSLYGKEAPLEEAVQMALLEYFGSLGYVDLSKRRDN